MGIWLAGAWGSPYCPGVPVHVALAADRPPLHPARLGPEPDSGTGFDTEILAPARLKWYQICEKKAESHRLVCLTPASPALRGPGGVRARTCPGETGGE